MTSYRRLVFVSINRCMFLDQLVNSLTVRIYCDHLLMLMPLRFNAMRGLSVAPLEYFMKKCSIQMMAPSCTPLVSHTNIKAERRLRIDIDSNESNNCDNICT